ncbi:MAG: DUF2306 domain-containing protein [Candidatus Saccharimonadales bacterium]
MHAPWTIVIVLHAVIATSTLVLGTFNAIRTVRGDTIHRAVGRIWAYMMLFVSISGLFIIKTHEPIDIFLGGLALWTIFSICAGIYNARRGDINAHKAFMLGSYFGLLGAFIGVIVVPTRLVPSWFLYQPILMTIITICIVAVSGLLVSLLIKTNGRPLVKSK